MNKAEGGRPGSGDHETAALLFASAERANRIVAGLPVAARMVRELAEAGFAEAWLVFPPMGDLTRYTQEEIRRLSGTMAVRLSAVPPDRAAITLSGEAWLPARALRGGDVRFEDAVIQLDRRSAAARILKATGKASDGPVSRWLNRPISRRISALLLWIVPAIHPVYVTWFNALLALAMFASLVVGGGAGIFVGALLFHAASVLDGVDGEIARATFRSSASGAALDSAIDMATNLLFFVGVCVNLWLAGDRGHALLGAWGVFLVLVGALIIARRGRGTPLTFDHIKHNYLHRFSTPLVQKVIRLGAVLTSRDFFALLGVVVVLAGVPKAIPYILAILATIWIPFVLDVPNRLISWAFVKREMPME